MMKKSRWEFDENHIKLFEFDDGYAMKLCLDKG